MRPSSGKSSKLVTRIQMSHDHLCKCFSRPVIVVVLQPSEVVVRLSVMTGRLGLTAEQKELEATGERQGDLNQCRINSGSNYTRELQV